MSMPSAVAGAYVFADRASLSDLQSYLTLARQADPEAAVRLHALGPVLAAYVGMLPGRGLSGAGTVLGLRTFALADPVESDNAVPVGAILDRLAWVLGHPENDPVIPVPPASVFVQWAAITPPRAGWVHAADVSSEDLLTVARTGIAQLGAAGTGLAAQVDALRARVWGEAMPAAGGAPGGMAFAAYGLRFLVENGSASVHRSGPWWRLSTSAGHVLAR